MKEMKKDLRKNEGIKLKRSSRFEEQIPKMTALSGLLELSLSLTKPQREFISGAHACSREAYFMLPSSPSMMRQIFFFYQVLE